MRHVFEDLLKLADYKTGIVDVTRQALSRKLNIPIDVLNRELEKLESPDPASRDPDHDGRRIERLDEHRDWGWRILNWQKYDAIKSRAQTAIRVSKHRESNPEIDAIYQAYPRHVGKPAAVPKIRKAIDDVGFDQLLKATKEYAEARRYEDQEFTPHPATWFGQQRYKDNPKTWKNGINQSTGRQSVDRSIGTANEGAADQYSKVV